MKGAVLGLLFFIQTASASIPTHGVAMHGNVKYEPNFTHFDYVNPDAPKGGVLKQSTFGGFDTFNPFSIKGTAAPGTGYLFDTLMVESLDEPFSQYGLLAQSIEMPDDRSWVAFNLHPDATFHDGSSVLAEDVVFSFNILKEKGVPQYRYYFGDVEKVEATSPRRVLFTFKPGDNRELPLILGEMPVLSKKDWEGKDFTATTLVPPIGSGPYQIEDFEPNRYIVYKRNPNYWGKDLPVNKGQYNFDEIRFDVYRDTTVAVEAFKAGAFDIRVENEAKKWATAYEDMPALKNGKVIKKDFKHGLPSGMQGFVFNTRRPIFANKKVRQALATAFDFKWSNENLFYGAYKRTTSYFDNSELAAKGLPKEGELKLLKKYEALLDSDVFQKEIDFPDISGDKLRPALMKALELLSEAGWTVQEGILKNEKQEPFEFEILLDTSGAAAWERIVLPYMRNLKKLGINASVRVMDVMQYKHRLDTFDYDMFVFVWGQSLSPGNEQRYFWGSSAADQPGSYNFAGIKDPAVDYLIEEVIQARSREELVDATRALDRVLLNGWYVVPHWYSPETHIIYWNKFGMPDTVPLKGMSLSSWWAL